MTRRRSPVVRAGLAGLAGLVGPLGLALALAVPAATGSPAAAERRAAVTHVQKNADGTVRLLVSVPADVVVDLDQVAVTIDGEPAEATSEAAGRATGVRRTAVLAIDTSNSMQGRKFTAAKAAAQQFLDSVPRDVHVGIVSFDSDVTTELAPTRDRAAARAVVDGLALDAGTLLYDGVLEALEVAGTAGQRSLLVLSDGADAGRTPLEDATTAITAREVLVDVVAVDQSPDALGPLQALATAGKGEVLPADVAALAATFAGEAAALARQVQVTARVPDGVTAAEAAIDVRLPTAAGILTASAFGPVQDPAAATPAAPLGGEAGLVLPEWGLYAGVGALGLGLLAFLVLLVPRPARAMTAEDRVTTYTTATSRRSKHAAKVDPQDAALATARSAAADLLKRNAGLEARIASRLEGAGSELKPAEWLLVHVAVVLGAGLLGLLVGGGNVLLGLLFLAVGVVGPWVYLGIRRTRRRKAFHQALPDTLQLMSGSLAAGLSLAQSVDTIVREGTRPISDEFRRVLVETRLGVPLEDALEGIADRFESEDFGWVVMAIKIQRQVGGNLGELLDTVAATMREREYVRRQVAALAAEGKLSAWVLGGLPPLFMLYLLMTNRDYVIVMFQSPVGWAMLAGAATVLAVGVFWMSRLVKVEV